MGFVAAVVLPATVAVAEGTDLLELLQAGLAVPVAAFAGLVAVLLARGARSRVKRTLGRVGGERTARAGRALGLLGLALAASGAIALAYYAYLTRY
ncbi:MAG: hypothetical protein H0T39_06845 [Actinobacteria bacterium]|nr:hypothetical protein [Actinomycetota bacterium]